MVVDTKESINLALKIIGRTGFDGLSVRSSSATEALPKVMRLKNLNYPLLIKELRRQGLVDIQKQSTRINFTITPAGIHRLQKVYILAIKLKKASGWDGRWRIVTFDIPLIYSRQRQALIKQLKRYGFYMLQRSLWVYPFPCFDEVEKIAGYYNVSRYLCFIEASQMDKLSNLKLRRFFNII